MRIGPGLATELGAEGPAFAGTPLANALGAKGAQLSGSRSKGGLVVFFRATES